MHTTAPRQMLFPHCIHISSIHSILYSHTRMTVRCFQSTRLVPAIALQSRNQRTLVARIISQLLFVFHSCIAIPASAGAENIHASSERHTRTARDGCHPALCAVRRVAYTSDAASGVSVLCKWR